MLWQKKKIRCTDVVEEAEALIAASTVPFFAESRTVAGLNYVCDAFPLLYSFTMKE